MIKKKITDKEEKYAEIVKIHDINNYEINTRKLNVGEAIECPHDKHLLVAKDGTDIYLFHTKHKIKIEKL